MQIAFHWGRDLIQSYFPCRWFLHRQISSPDIYSVSGDANDHVSPPPLCVSCVCVCVAEAEADGSAVWCLEGCMEMLAESCWSPACIHHSTSLHFPQLFKKKKPDTHTTISQSHSPLALFYPLFPFLSTLFSSYFALLLSFLYATCHFISSDALSTVSLARLYSLPWVFSSLPVSPCLINVS